MEYIFQEPKTSVQRTHLINQKVFFHENSAKFKISTYINTQTHFFPSKGGEKRGMEHWWGWGG